MSLGKRLPVCENNQGTWLLGVVTPCIVG